jgi:DNA polymerase III sliding clamp (beta) subunit (PCNA family)
VKLPQRSDVVALLDKVKATLATKDLIPIYACFCFTDKTVYAFDDVVCLTMPAKFGFTGGIRGDLLFGFLNNSKAKEIEIITGETNATIKAGRSKLDAPLMPATDFLFELPEMGKGATETPLDGKFIEGLTKVAVSMGRDASQTWRYGVTVVPQGSGFILYSTDDKTVCRATVGKPEGDKGEPSLLPPRFVDLLTTIAKTDKPKTMKMTEDWIEVKFQSGLTLFSKGVVGASPGKYATLLASIKESVKAVVEIPVRLKGCLERSALVAKFAQNPHCRLTVADNVLKLVTQSEQGDVRDSLPFEHEDVDMHVSPDIVTRGLEFCDKISILPSCVRMVGKNVIFCACANQPATPAAEVDPSGDAETTEE